MILNEKIKRAMFANLKEQKDTARLLNACKKANDVDSIRFYQNKLDVLDKHFYELIKQYEDCISD